uniref:Glycosyltransferase-like protein n=1 Tax=Chlorobium chlorochromatii (strain CaD3) TaxID=340177 RepID=Q3AQI8_CHLCH
MQKSINIFTPDKITLPLSWVGHIPFAAWLVEILHPQILVELGTHSGNLYFAFCQTVKKNQLLTKCYTVDTWKEAQHSGIYDNNVYNEILAYNSTIYGDFSQLFCMTFDEALTKFENGSIDLLHINGEYTYQAARKDFETWLPKMSNKGIILFHDIMVKEREFGVYRLWEELSSQYGHFEFTHSHGLGVLLTGKNQHPAIESMAQDFQDTQKKKLISGYFEHSGYAIELEYQHQSDATKIHKLSQQLKSQSLQINSLQKHNQSLQHEIQELNKSLVRITNSSSWRLTKPIRKWSKSLRKRFRKIRYFLTGETAENVPKRLTTLCNNWFKPTDKTRILIIDSWIPAPDQDSGSMDTFLTMKALVELGYDITFIPKDLKAKQKYVQLLENEGVRYPDLSKAAISIEEFLKVAGHYFDLVMLYRVDTASSFLAMVKHYAPQAKIVFNTVDLHFLREQRNAELSGSDIMRKNALKTKEHELQLMQQADSTIVLSNVEFDLVKKIKPEVNLELMPFFRMIPGRSAAFHERKNIVFIGGFKHQPNLDAITYFISEIWPKVHLKLHDAKLRIIGSNPPKELYRLVDSDNTIELLGYVANLDPEFNTCKLTVAPLRSGAGIKGKIVTSLSYGVPCVASPIASEGMELIPDKDLLVAKEPDEFANKIIKLYTDEALWNALSDNALTTVEERYSYKAGKKRIGDFLNKLLGSSRHSVWGSEEFLQNNLANETDDTDGKKRIIIELPSFDKGGLEKVVLDSILAFNKNKFHFLIVTPGKLGELSTVATNAGLSVIQLPDINHEAAYERLVIKYRPHASMSHFSHLGYPVFINHHIPNITFIHNVYAFLSEKHKKEIMMYDHAVTRYIAVSPKVACYAEKNLGINQEKITIIPNGLCITEHEERQKRATPALRDDFGLNKNDFVFLNPASYNLHKGHYIMVDALQIVTKKRKDLKILCVGNIVHEPHYHELQQYIISCGLSEHMLMLGYISKIENIMPIVDACIMPSFIEGWSIAMNEAMFYGKPLIMTDTGGASEVIENNDIGILIPNEYGASDLLDRTTLDKLAYKPHHYKISSMVADAMIAFADNHEYWKKAGEKGRKKIYRHYAFKNVVAQYEEIMNQVTEPVTYEPQ